MRSASPSMASSRKRRHSGQSECSAGATEVERVMRSAGSAGRRRPVARSTVPPGVPRRQGSASQAPAWASSGSDRAQRSIVATRAEPGSSWPAARSAARTGPRDVPACAARSRRRRRTSGAVVEQRAGGRLGEAARRRVGRDRRAGRGGRRRIIATKRLLHRGPVRKLGPAVDPAVPLIGEGDLTRDRGIVAEGVLDARHDKIVTHETVIMPFPRDVKAGRSAGATPAA